MGRCRRLPVHVSLVLLALSLAGCGAPIPANSPTLGGKQLSDMTLTALDGKAVQFKQIAAGKVALVDVWATWCGPCLAAMPHLQALHNQFHDRGFTVIGIMIDKNATRIGPGFMKDRSVTYPVLMDDDGEKIESNIGSVQGIPLMLLIDRDGKVVQTFQGFGDPTILKNAVESALKGA